MKLLEKSNRNLRLKEELIEAIEETAEACSIEKDEAKKAEHLFDLIQVNHKYSELFKGRDLEDYIISSLNKYRIGRVEI